MSEFKLKCLASEYKYATMMVLVLAEWSGLYSVTPRGSNAIKEK